MPELRLIPFDLINEPPFPMREQFADTPFQDLVESIGKSGIQSPLLVRPVDGRYEIMGGHRRYRAAGVCALRELPCLVEDCNEEKAFEVMVAENTGREDPTPTEEGRFYLGLMERFKCSQEKVAEVVKKSVEYVATRIDLVSCDEDIANAVRDRLITFAVAKELLRVNPYTAALVLRCHVEQVNPEQRAFIEQHRGRLLRLCVESGATGALTRNYVEQWKRSLMPNNTFVQGGTNGDSPASAVVQLPRCLVCGRDGDPYNMKDIKVHFWELDKVKAVLREAGIPVYD
jgi:ParB/RepB/Spo0J family partition protein